MKRNSFNIGQHLIFNQLYCQIIDITQKDIFIQSISDSHKIQIKKNDVEHLINRQILSFMPNNESEIATSSISLTAVTKEQTPLVLKRYKYIQAAQKLYPKPQKSGLEEIIEEVSKKISDSSPPSVSTLYRWWCRWLGSNKELKSLEDKPSGKRGYRSYKASINAIFYEVVNEVYLTKERQSKQEVCFTLSSRIKQHNQLHHQQIKIPSRATIYRMLDDLDDYTVMAERYGTKEADKVYRISGKGIKTNYPLERTEIDHTPLDVMVVDEKTGLTIGRPNLTCILDGHTRLPLALEIGFEPPSELSVIRALKQAIWPKDDLLKSFHGIKKSWPAYGIPSLLVCDNGLEFHSEHLRRVCGELNIELMFCPKHKPQYKGRVERFLGTLNHQLTQRIKGTTFSNIIERGEYNSVEEAVITLAELQETIYIWAIDIYMQTPHSSINMSPYNKWVKDIQRIPPVLPRDRNQFNLICAKEYHRKLSHVGVFFKRLTYNSELLKTMRIIYGNKTSITFRVNQENLEKIWVYDPNTDTFEEVPSTDQDYAKNLTLLQHELILEERRIQLIEANNTNDVSLTSARNTLSQKIKSLSSDKRIKQRTKAARVGEIPPNPKVLPITPKQQDTFKIDNVPDFKIITNNN